MATLDDYLGIEDPITRIDFLRNLFSGNPVESYILFSKMIDRYQPFEEIGSTAPDTETSGSDRLYQSRADEGTYHGRVLFGNKGQVNSLMMEFASQYKLTDVNLTRIRAHLIIGQKKNEPSTQVPIYYGCFLEHSDQEGCLMTQCSQGLVSFTIAYDQIMQKLIAYSSSCPLSQAPS